MNPTDVRRVFLSYNKADRPVARAVGSHLVLVGTDVWFDEWEISAGDSIPGKLNEGLESFHFFVLLWSGAAARSSWVRTELQSAIHRSITAGTAKIIPCVLDETPLPPLVAHIKQLSLVETSNGIGVLIEEITGLRGRKARLRAIQETLLTSDFNWSLSPGLGPYLCCPKCGDEHHLMFGAETDPVHCEDYPWVVCESCGWRG